MKHMTTKQRLRNVKKAIAGNIKRRVAKFKQETAMEKRVKHSEMLAMLLTIQAKKGHLRNNPFNRCYNIKMFDKPREDGVQGRLVFTHPSKY